MRAGIFCFGFVAARVNFFCKTDVIKLHNFNQCVLCKDFGEIKDKRLIKM
jgi:hypothetical protein